MYKLAKEINRFLDMGIPLADKTFKLDSYNSCPEEKEEAIKYINAYWKRVKLTRCERISTIYDNMKELSDPSQLSPKRFLDFFIETCAIHVAYFLGCDQLSQKFEQYCRNQDKESALSFMSNMLDHLSTRKR